ncbi:hypothetical protein GCM10010501_67320 [Streptomyces libani subsp. rufus]|nr:hypothetical protein GCM10010501_67320 [Streptomyces libani subsp. rufus]
MRAEDSRADWRLRMPSCTARTSAGAPPAIDSVTATVRRPPLSKGELVIGDRIQAAVPTGYNRGPFGRLRGRVQFLGGRVWIPVARWSRTSAPPPRGASGSGAV